MKAEIAKFKSGQGGLGECQAIFGRLAKMAQGVGKCCAAADLLKSLFDEKGVPVVEIKPSDRHRADRPPSSGKQPLAIGFLSMPTKTSAHQFEQMTGYMGRSSEHSRDACTTVWGKSIYWAETMIERQKEKKKELETVDGEKVKIEKGKFFLVSRK